MLHQTCINFCSKTMLYNLFCFSNVFKVVHHECSFQPITFNVDYYYYTERVGIVRVGTMYKIMRAKKFVTRMFKKVLLSLIICSNPKHRHPIFRIFKNAKHGLEKLNIKCHLPAVVWHIRNEAAVSVSVDVPK